MKRFMLSTAVCMYVLFMFTACSKDGDEDNDGQQYNVDPEEQNSPGVIPVIWKGKDKIEAGGQMVWR